MTKKLSLAKKKKKKKKKRKKEKKKKLGNYWIKLTKEIDNYMQSISKLLMILIKGKFKLTSWKIFFSGLQFIVEVNYNVLSLYLLWHIILFKDIEYFHLVTQLTFV